METRHEVESQPLLETAQNAGSSSGQRKGASWLTGTGLLLSKTSRVERSNEQPRTQPAVGQADAVDLEAIRASTPLEVEKLGTFMGVFVPVVNSIIGVVLFLRLGFVIGQAGILGASALFTWANLGVFLTVLSTAAIVTNGQVRGGGVYFFLSRTLGREFGGAIGLIFYLANVFAGAFYVVGFVEALLGNAMKQVPTMENPNPSADIGAGLFLRAYGWWPFLYSTVTLAIATFIAFVGSKIFAKTSAFIFAIVCGSVFMIMLSLSVRNPFDHLLPTPEAPVEAESVRFTGISGHTFSRNFLWNFTTDEHGKMMDFQTIFAILYPAVTGTQSGASLSGDLKRPSHAIPRGTLFALGGCFVTYALLILLIGASTMHETLVANYHFLGPISLIRGMVQIGIVSSTLSSVLTSVLGASRILQALAKDNILGPLRVLAKGYGKNQEPVLCVAVTAVLVEVLLLLGELNAIAPFVTLFYLMADAGMNLALLALIVSSTPNFRPTWKYYNRATCTVGLVITTISMLYVNASYAGLTVLLMMCLVFYVRMTSGGGSVLREAEVYARPDPGGEEGDDWGIVSEALVYHQVRKFLLRLGREGEIHIKHWRPQILLLLAPRRVIGKGHWAPFPVIAQKEREGNSDQNTADTGRTSKSPRSFSRASMPLRWGSDAPFWRTAATSQASLEALASRKPNKNSTENRNSTKAGSDVTPFRSSLAKSRDLAEQSSDEDWEPESRIMPRMDQSASSDFHRPSRQSLKYMPSPSHIPLISFINSLKKSGLFMIGQTVTNVRDRSSRSHAGSEESEFGERIFQARYQVHQNWTSFVKDLNVKAFIETSIAQRFREGALGIVSACGLGVLRPNIVLMEWPSEAICYARSRSAAPSPSVSVSNSPALLPDAPPVPPLPSNAAALAGEGPIRGSPRLEPPMNLSSPLLPQQYCLGGFPEDSQVLSLVHDYVTVLTYALGLGKSVGLTRGFTSEPVMHKMLRAKSPMAMFLNHQAVQKSSSALESHSLLSEKSTSQQNAQSLLDSVADLTQETDGNKFVDIWPLVNIVFDEQDTGEATAHPDDDIADHEVAHVLALQLGYVLHNSSEWKKSTTLRITRIVASEHQVEPAKRKLKLYLKSLRIRAVLRIYSIEQLLLDLEAAGRKSHVILETWKSVPVEDKMAITNEFFRLHSGPDNGTSVILTTLPPPPSTSGGSMVKSIPDGCDAQTKQRETPSSLLHVKSQHNGTLDSRDSLNVQTRSEGNPSDRSDESIVSPMKASFDYWKTVDRLSGGLESPIVLLYGRNWVVG